MNICLPSARNKRAFLICVSLLFVISVHGVNAQWASGVLSQERFSLAATSIGNKALFAGGSAQNYQMSSIVDIYDNQTDAWSTAYLSAPRFELAATAAGSKAFFAGGHTGSEYSDIVDIYDNTTNTWTTEKLSEPRSQLCATSAGSKVFFAGGRKSGGAERSDVVDVYDTKTNTWSIHRLSQARCWLAAASIGNKVIFAGGLDRYSGPSSVVDIYDTSNGSWSTYELSKARSDLAATSVGQKIIFAGGHTPLGESDVVDIYDYRTDTWSTHRLSVGRFDLAATSTGGKAIFAGGHTVSGSVTSNAVDIYDASANVWSTSKLPSARNSIGATSVGTKAFFAGGWGSVGAKPMRDVDIYELHRIKDSKAPEIFITYRNEGTKNTRGRIGVEIHVIDASSITSVVINNEKQSIKQPVDSLTFSYEFFEGQEIAVIATDHFDNEKDKSFIIKLPASASNKSQPSESLADSQRKYYALLIGVDTYTDPGIVSLNEPIKDATLLKNVLSKKYSFKESDIMFLKNPTFEEMTVAFDSLVHKVTPDDFLLIFYAGHGDLDQRTKIGYWLPSDATKRNTAKWYRNSVLVENIGAITSKHTILISDACFSGNIFKSRGLDNNASTGINNMMKLPSRKAMTSGAQTTVPDKSVFMKYLLKYLQENDKQYLPSVDLYYSIRMAMSNNADTVPQYGEIQGAGHEGGDFVFYQPQ